MKITCNCRWTADFSERPDHGSIVDALCPEQIIGWPSWNHRSIIFVITAVEGTSMYKKIFGEKVGSIRWLFAISGCTSLILSVLFLIFWLYVGVIDEICVIPMEGGGLIPLHNTYGPGVYCNPLWVGILLSVTYFSLIFFCFIFPLLCFLRFLFYVIVRK